MDARIKSGHDGSTFSNDQTVIARSEATKQSILPLRGENGLLRGACHRARIRATRWLAMTLIQLHTPTSSRREAPEVCVYLPLSSNRGRGERRVPAAPAASCALCIGRIAHE